MKKFLFIDTWNGECMSNSTASIEVLNNDAHAKDRALEMALSFNNNKQGLVQHIADAPEGFRLQYTSHGIPEDAGAVHMLDFDEATVGVIVIPNVNHYEVVTTQKRWDEVQEYVKQNSENYELGEDIFGSLHEAMENEYDWILIPVADLFKKTEEQMEFVEGDGVEFETWQHKTTKELFKVPIEINRNFAAAEKI